MNWLNNAILNWLHLPLTKKLEIYKNLEIELEIYKNLEYELEIDKNLEIFESIFEFFCQYRVHFREKCKISSSISSFL